MEVNNGKDPTVWRKIEKQSNQKQRIYHERKSMSNISILMNLHQDFRMVIASVDRTMMDI